MVDNSKIDDDNTDQVQSSKEDTSLVEELDPPQSDDDPSLNIQQLAREFQSVEKESKPLMNQIIITFSLLFGPIFLVILLVFDRISLILGNAPLFISGGITIIYLLSAIYKAWHKSTTND